MPINPYDYTQPGNRPVDPYLWCRPIEGRGYISIVPSMVAVNPPGGAVPINELEIENWIETPDLAARSDSVSPPVIVWWTLDVWGFETWRDTIVTPIPSQGPATAWQGGQNEFPSGGVWPGHSVAGIRTTRYQLRLRYDGGTGVTRTVDLDIGPGHPISVCAPQVRASLLVPRGTIQKRPGESAVLPIGNNERAIDTVIAGRLVGSFAPVGNRVATYTQLVDVLTDTMRTVQIPPGAIRLQIYTIVGGDTTPLRWMFGLASNDATPSTAVLGPAIGAIGIDATLLRTTRLSVPGVATHVFIPAVASARRFLFVWEIGL